jgi:hypothetical protein
MRLQRWPLPSPPTLLPLPTPPLRVVQLPRWPPLQPQVPTPPPPPPPPPMPPPLCKLP